MKKRILAILLTASLLVGAMAASAMAAAPLTSLGVYDTGLTTDQGSSGTVAQFGTSILALMAVPTAGATAMTVNFTATSSNTSVATVELANTSVATVGMTAVAAGAATTNFTITGVTAGTSTITFTATNAADATDTKSCTFTVTVTAAPKPKFTADASNLDIGAIWDSTNGGFYSGQIITSKDFSTDVSSADSVKWFEATFANFTHSTGTKLEGSISPTTSGLTFTAVSADETAPGTGTNSSPTLRGYLSGTVANVNATTNYTLTVKATDAAGTVTNTYKFKVMPAPKITSATPTDIVWGKAWSFKPTATNAQSWDIAVSADNSETYLWASDSAFVSKDALVNNANLKFQNSNGQLSGTWKATIASDDGFIGLNAWDGKTVTKKVMLRAFNGQGDKAATATQTFTLRFVGVAPTLDKTTATATSAFSSAKFMYGESKPTSGDSTAVAITATAPGRISWDVDDDLLPAGLSYDWAHDESKYESTLKIFGSPDVTVKNQKLSIEAYNEFGSSVTLEPTITIGSNTFTVCISTDTELISGDATEGNLPSGDTTVGSTFATVNLRALPGPVTWDTTNLPSGVTLTVNTDDSTKATLSGTLMAGRTAKTHAAKNYAIKATNANISKNGTISQDLMVFAAPTIDTEFLFNKKNTINTKTALNYTVPTSNFPEKASWDISINGTKIIENSAPTSGYTDGWKPTAYDTTVDQTHALSVDLAALSKDETLKFIGSLDVVPTGGGTFTVSITGRNLADSVTKDFTIAVKGTAPALKKQDLTLSGTGTSNSKDITITAGDAPVTMTAYVDSKTAKKIFGVEEDIDLSSANATGLRFEYNNSGKGFIYAEAPTSNDSFYYGSAGVAYNKLPVTVTAVNTDISDKVASAKYTVTKSGTSLTLTTSNDLTAYGNSALTKGATLASAVAMKTLANQALASDSEYVVFVPKGSGPYDITVKPETKNGLTATVADNGNVTIAGTPTATKKDVATKFSITLKNPSTGDTAKSDITITAKPTPEAAGNISKTLIVGKNLKLAPKAKVSNNGMEWAIATISRDNNAVTVDALSDTYGITFDETKGTLSGTTKAATGSTSPLIVTMFASSDVAQSDPITATITILGEKAKLTTKKLTILKDGTDISNAKVDTNLSSVTDTNRAHVQFMATFDDALAGITATDSNNSMTFGGTPSAVTKKQTVEVIMNNFDTETKGKLSFTVVGSKPLITGDTSVTVSAGESQTLSLTLSNQGDVGSKVKWKITQKPSGASAKVKGDVNGATVTVKAAKKAKSTTTTFKVTATDSISKTTSDAYEVTVTVVGIDAASEKALETKDAAPETKDAIALGEGEVTFGAERTAGSLTAAQRRVIAEQGYVIAAVLPEIEVTADGQYDFEVDLDEEVAAGAELVWFAFSSKPTTDDEIVDFADENGKETKVVPESHIVIVTPWLNAGTKYAPVIAVKADAGEAEATTAEGVKEAAEEKAE